MTEEEAVRAIDDAVSDWHAEQSTWAQALDKIRLVINEYGSDEYQRGLSDGAYNESRNSISPLGFFDRD